MDLVGSVKVDVHLCTINLGLLGNNVFPEFRSKTHNLAF